MGDRRRANLDGDVAGAVAGVGGSTPQGTDVKVWFDALPGDAHMPAVYT